MVGLLCVHLGISLCISAYWTAQLSNMHCRRLLLLLNCIFQYFITFSSKIFPYYVQSIAHRRRRHALTY